MNRILKTLTALVLIVALLVAVAIGCQPQRAEIQPMGVTNLDSLHLSDTGGTATPILMVDGPSGNSGNLVEARVASTPVWYINASGAEVSTGSQTYSGGQTFNNWVKVSAPTAVATATPAAVVDSLGVSVLLDVRDAATPVFSINNGGAWTSTGAGTHSGGQTVNNWGVVSAPTAIATATPAFVVDSLGVSALFEVRDAATPVFQIANGGTVDLNSKPLSNIGAAGTDFGSDGSLTTAQTITITAGGLVVGAGGIDVQGGDITMQNDETLSNATNGTISATVAANGFFDVVTGNLVVGDPSGASLTLNGNDAYVQGSLEADGLSRLDGGASVAGDLEISNGLFLPMFDDLTINDGDTVTVTTISVYGLDSSGNVTMTLAACSHDGQTATLIGDDANTITINATNLRTTDGNALTLGQYDVIVLVCQDTEWLHVSKSANQ